MKNKKILLVLSGFFVAVSALLFFVPKFVQADSNYGLDATAQSAGLPMTKDLASILGNVIGSALSLISILFFGLMLYGGITWMTARGKPENTAKALDTIIAATIGIVIILAAYAITNFVFSNVISGSGGPSTPRGGPLQIDVNCGNGVLDSGEPCDDNGNIGNGCKIDCTVESGWTCAPDPSFPGTSSCTRTGTGVVGSLCPNGNECLASLNCNSSTKKCEVANSDPAPQKWCLPTGGTCHQVTGDCPTGEVPYDFIATCKSNEVSVSPVGCYCTNENDVAVLGGGEKFFDYSSEECATRIDIQSISGGSGCTYK